MKKKREMPPGFPIKRRDDDHLSVVIDPHRLDEEWVAHPDRMQKVGELSADANDRVERMKSALEVVKAKVELRIRRKPQAFGLDKATDNSVKAALEANDEVIEAVDRLNKAKHRAGLLKALYEARRDCRPALENLVKLHLGAYFSDPKGPAGADRQQALRIVADELFKPITSKKKRRTT